MKKLLLALGVVAGMLVLASVASAQESRWVETHRWKGSGTVQTERFLVNADKWRVRYHPEGSGIFQINVFDGDGALVDVAANWSKPMNGYRNFKGKGIRYLSITGPDTTWVVMIEQYLTAIEEWHLDQMIKLPPRHLNKLATWVGDDTSGVRYELDIPAGSWQIVHGQTASGFLQVLVRDDGGRVVVAANSSQPGDAVSWVHESGKFVVEIVAIKTQWKVDIYGE